MHTRPKSVGSQSSERFVNIFLTCCCVYISPCYDARLQSAGRPKYPPPPSQSRATTHHVCFMKGCSRGFWSSLDKQLLHFLHFLPKYNIIIHIQARVPRSIVLCAGNEPSAFGRPQKNNLRELKLGWQLNIDMLFPKRAFASEKRLTISAVGEGDFRLLVNVRTWGRGKRK